jgi:N-acetylmuramoyl-L-alanine amidase
MRNCVEAHRFRLAATLLLVCALLGGIPAPAAAQGAEQIYTSALARERALRDADRRPTLKQLRALALSYLRVVSRYPKSGYCDNALWQAAGLYALAFERFRQDTDRRRSREMLQRMRSEYPASSLIARSDEILELLSPRPAAPSVPPRATAPVTAASSGPEKLAREAVDKPASAQPPAGTVTLSAVNRADIGNVVRVTLELDAETAYHEERVDDPARVFFDLRQVRLGPGLREAPINFEADVVRQVRLGRRADGSTRVAMDLRGVNRYSVFTLYNPYRLVIDFERSASATALRAAMTPDTAGPRAPAPAAGPGSAVPRSGEDTRGESTPVRATADPPLPVGSSPLRVKSAPVAAVPRSAVPNAAASPADSRGPKAPLPSEPTKPTDTPIPAVPAANGSGNYSLARQLGLGVARVVIDPGHGGHDPGAQGHRVVESELVLDVALRLEKLLLKEHGVEVVLTRRTDVFIPLEERTAIANRASADLFLSIHANASQNASARGVETYYLNFASNPEAEAVAARENSASSRTLHVLPDIIKAIALNNKLDESRDFAELVQRAMARRLRGQNGHLKNLGVKRAPFVVLIGAGMPSVLAEISFVTNKQEASLLRTAGYRQRIAEALFDAVTEYQQSLKKITAVADSTR